jgi:hypothetical protein
MDMVREELEHSIDDQEDRRSVAKLSKQGTIAAAQANEEDRDLDDPDFAAKKVQN